MKKQNIWQTEKKSLGNISMIIGIIVVILITINFCINVRNKIIIEKYIMLINSIENEDKSFSHSNELNEHEDLENYCSDMIESKNIFSLVSDLIIYSIVVITIIFFRYNRVRQAERLDFQINISNILSNETENVYIFRDSSNSKNDFVSNNSKKILGISAEKLMENQSLFYERIVSDDRKKIQEYENNDNEIGKEYSIEFEYYHPELEEVRNMFLKSYFIYSQGFMPCYIYVLEDLTEIVKSKKILEKKVQKSINESKAKSDYLSSISHDLRTPIHGITGMASLAQMDIDNKEVVGTCLNKILISSNHLLGLINKVLDISEIEQNKITLKEEKVEIIKLINKIVRTEKPRCNQKNIELLYNKYEIKDRILLLDEVRLSQIIYNVINNAIKYTRDGGKIILDVYENKSKFDGCIEYTFKITDNGIGMSKEYAKHIFEPFSREKDVNSTNIEGTGLGMAITKGLVNIMNGQIDVYSVQGEGTCIKIKLNLKKYINQSDEKASLINKQSLNKEKKKYDKDAYSKIRAFVVDDQEMNLYIAKGFLEKIGVQVETCQNSVEAYEKLYRTQNNYYDIIFMDIQMPDMNGYELTNLLRKSDKSYLKKIPIYAMTADGFNKDIEKANQAEMNGHISKPFEIEDLYIVLNKLLECNGKK